MLHNKHFVSEILLFRNFLFYTPRLMKYKVERVTCKRFRHCADFRLGRYECDHQGEGCIRFREKHADFKSLELVVVTEFET